MNAIIHLDAAEAALRLDRETLIMLLETFFSTRKEYTEPIRLAIEGLDRNGLKQEAHRLKGAANNLRVDGIGKIALDLESASEEMDKGVLSQLYTRLEQAFDMGDDELMELKNP